jgi:hypothetical protein
LNVRRWESLFHSFTERRRERDERSRVSDELATWYDEQTNLVMTLLREVASERAETFKHNAGVQVEVRWPSHPPINVGPDGPFMSFMTLRVGEREVHLYSHRVGLAAPSLHYVVSRASQAERAREGLLGRPGCRIEQREGGGFLLRSVTPGTGPEVLSVDDIVFRAFELLLE